MRRAAAVVGDLGRAQLAGKRVVGGRGGGGDFGTDMAGDLDSGAADRAGRSGDEQAFTGGKSGAVDQELGCGETAKEEGGALFEAKGVGQGQDGPVAGIVRYSAWAPPLNPFRPKTR